MVLEIVGELISMNGFHLAIKISLKKLRQGIHGTP
jgi:hypothetical protein